MQKIFLATRPRSRVAGSKLRGPDAKLGSRISRARPFLFPRNNLKFCLPVLFTQRTGYVDRASGGSSPYERLISCRYVFRVRDADCRSRQHRGDIRIREKKRSARYKTIASLIIGGTTVFKSSPYVSDDRSQTGGEKKRRRERESATYLFFINP